MHALVTGAAGFLGSALVDRLLAEGHSVEAVDDLSGGSLANLAEARAARGAFRFHQLDVRDAALVDLITRLRPEVVFHLASPTSSGTGFDQPVLEAEVNVIGTLRVLEGARAARCRKVVFAASWACYGELDPSELPAHEHLPLRPICPHGAAKRAALDFLRAYRERHGLEFSALALASVYGPRRLQSADPGAVAAFALDVAAGRACTVTGDGGQTRDFVYVDDAVDALSKAGGRGSGLLLNVGTGRETSLEGLLLLIGRLVGRLPRIRHVPAVPGEPRRCVLDPSRSEIHLGWQPWTTLEEGTRAVLEAAGVLGGPRALSR